MRSSSVGTTLLGVLITLVSLPTRGADADPLGLRAIRDQAHGIEVTPSIRSIACPLRIA